MKWTLGIALIMIGIIAFIASSASEKSVTLNKALELCEDAANSYLGTQKSAINKTVDYFAFDLEEALDPELTGAPDTEIVRAATIAAYDSGKTAGLFYTKFALPTSSVGIKVQCSFNYSSTGLVRLDSMSINDIQIPEIKFKLNVDSETKLKISNLSERDISFYDKLNAIFKTSFWSIQY